MNNFWLPASGLEALPRKTFFPFPQTGPVEGTGIPITSNLNSPSISATQVLRPVSVVNESFVLRGCTWRLHHPTVSLTRTKIAVASGKRIDGDFGGLVVQRR
jgi:hypothetical protein